MVRDACLRAQDALRVCGVVWKYRWVTIRIQASSTDCEGSIKHCGFFWLCTTRLLDGAFVFNLLQLLWGRWEAEGMRTEFICVGCVPLSCGSRGTLFGSGSPSLLFTFHRSTWRPLVRGTFVLTGVRC
ncbi:hypothetical protein BCY84_08110 [Trypanosoma cruzi cruzi]|nr:hypothetical protein BCY84_08110 [Trypanosoma cruzi cruzi]